MSRRKTVGLAKRSSSDASLARTFNDYQTRSSGSVPPKATESDPVIGNVCNETVLPPDWNGTRALRRKDLDTGGQPERGTLIFDASFESGNLGRVDCISPTEFDLFIRPDTCNPKYRLWFSFTVQNVKSGQRVIFNVVNFSKVKSLYTDGMSPVVKTSSRPKWQRIPSQHINYARSAPHNDRFIMSFAFAFDREDDIYHFAYCFPYSYTDLQNYLSGIEAKNLPYFRRDVLGLTVQQRRLDLLTITDTENMSVSNKQRVIFFTARVHPGETPASYACQGLIDFLISTSVAAKELRKRYVFKIVPMLNPDGVALGNYRCSLMGFDLNRHWQLPSSWAHPTVHATKNLLLQYDQNTQMDLLLYIDIHAHSTKYGAFCYGNVFSKDPERCDRQLLLPVLLSKLSEDFSLDGTNFNTDAGKSGTSRRTMAGSLNVNCLCYTLEVSFFGFKNSEKPRDVTQYNMELYRRIGNNLGLSILSFSDVESGLKPLPLFPRPFHTFIPQRAMSGYIPSNGIVSIKQTGGTTKKKPKRKPIGTNSNSTINF